ncbi:hypothetical protein ABVV53_16465 [Novosphingobium sp. RD2P27]|uniref:Uncharacterized protein n=1 Tax=Novosphingobium kalidii TaxID=3230299 RepID=A0ABV2D5Q0_9SPHN
MSIRPTPAVPLSASVMLPIGSGRTAEGDGSDPAALLAAGAKALPLAPEASRTGSAPGKLLTPDNLAQLLNGNDGPVELGGLNTALARRQVLPHAIMRPEAGYGAEGARLTRSEHPAGPTDGDLNRATTGHAVTPLPDSASGGGGANTAPDLPISSHFQFLPGQVGMNRDDSGHTDEIMPEAMKSPSQRSADETEPLSLKAYPLALALVGERWRIKRAGFALVGIALFGLWYFR